MLELVLASHNKKKIDELQNIFSCCLSEDIKILSLSDIGFKGDIEEDGNSFEENALIKARVPASCGYIGIADDSGLCVDSLGGEPGIYSARYAGEGASDADNRIKLLSKLSNVSDSDRDASFVCAMALVLPDNTKLKIPERYRADKAVCKNAGISEQKAAAVRGECRGVILNKEIGNGGFGYDSLFYCREYKGTFAQITAEEKNKISHRGAASKLFAELINDILNYSI